MVLLAISISVYILLAYVSFIRINPFYCNTRCSFGIPSSAVTPLQKIRP